MADDMLELLLRDINPTVINAFVRQIQTPADYLLTQSVFPERTVNSVKWKTRGTKRRVAAASYRAWNAQVKVADREIQRYETEGQLLPLGQKYTIDELQVILEAVSRGMDGEDLKDSIWDDT